MVRRVAHAAAWAVALAAVLPAAAPGGADSVLPAIEWQDGRSQLLLVDPLTLQRAGPASVALDRPHDWAFSPDRRQLAFGGFNVPGLRLVDLETMQAVADIRLGGEIATRGIAWIAPRRLLVLVGSCCDWSVEVVAVDPVARRVLARTPLPSAVQQVARIDDGLVLLLAPPTRIGPTRLAVVDAGGRVRSRRLERVRGGSVWTRDGSTPRGRVQNPALAVDPASRRAFVVGVDGSIATVWLDSLAVSYHPLGAGTFLKLVEGRTRMARWLGDGMIALSGQDMHITGRGRDARNSWEPAGLRLLDTRDLSVRTLDPSQSWFRYASQLLLVNAEGSAGRELVAYGADGVVRFRTPLGAVGGLPEVVGGYAYSWSSWSSDPHTVTVIRLADGSIAGRIETSARLTLIGDRDALER